MTATINHDSPAPDAPPAPPALPRFMRDLPSTRVQVEEFMRRNPHRVIQGNAAGCYAIVGLPADLYHGDRSAVSRTQLQEVLRSSAHFREKVLAKATPSTPSQRLGTAVHCALLETNTFIATYFASHAPKRSHKQYKLDAARNPNKTVLTDLEYTTICRTIAGALRCINFDLRTALEQAPDGGWAHSELTIYWRHEATGLPMRARLDRLLYHPGSGDGLILDLKTLDDCSVQGMLLQVGLHNLDFQQAMYCDAAKALTGSQLPFMLVGCEVSPPHLCQAHMIASRSAQAVNGSLKFNDAVHALRVYTAEDSFDGTRDISGPVPLAELPLLPKQRYVPRF